MYVVDNLYFSCTPAVQRHKNKVFTVFFYVFSLFFFWKFAKESQKYIEETKLRVVLTSAPSSPVKPHTSLFSMQEPSNDILMPKEPYSPVLLPVNGVKKQEPHYETPIPQDTVQNGVENSLPPDSVRNLDTTSL